MTEVPLPRLIQRASRSFFLFHFPRSFKRRSTRSSRPRRFTTSKSKSKSKQPAAAQQISLIDFDDEPSPSSATGSSNPLDDLTGLSSLSLGPTTSSSPFSNPSPQQQPRQPTRELSLFDLNPSGFSAPSSPYSAPPAPATSNSSSSAYFNNPAYHNGNAASSSAGASGTSSPIVWGSGPGAATGRSSTPVVPGAIQLSGAGGAGRGTMGTGNPWSQPPQQGHQAGKPDPFGDLLL